MPEPPVEEEGGGVTRPHWTANDDADAIVHARSPGVALQYFLTASQQTAGAPNRGEYAYCQQLALLHGDCSPGANVHAPFALPMHE